MSKVDFHCYRCNTTKKIASLSETTPSPTGKPCCKSCAVSTIPKGVYWIANRKLSSKQAKFIENRYAKVE